MVAQADGLDEYSKRHKKILISVLEELLKGPKKQTNLSKELGYDIIPVVSCLGYLQGKKLVEEDMRNFIVKEGEPAVVDSIYRINNGSSSSVNKYLDLLKIYE